MLIVAQSTNEVINVGIFLVYLVDVCGWCSRDVCMYTNYPYTSS